MLLAVAARGDDGRDDDDMTERQKSEESSRAAAQWRLARVLCIKHFSHSAVFLSPSICLQLPLYVQ